MHLAGILDTSTVDFPGKICSVIFFSGCPFRCPYCQNYRILDIRSGYKVNVDFIIDQIKDNFLIDGICLSGGEPLMQNLDELKELIRKIKDLGLDVKLDTNGYYPDKLSEIISLLDYVAIDFKATPEFYPKVTGKKDSYNKLISSIKIVIDSGINYEIRTTVVPTIVDKNGILRIVNILSDLGVKRYVLQQFRNNDVLDEKFKKINPYPKEYLIDVGRQAKKVIPEVVVRCDSEIEL